MSCEPTPLLSATQKNALQLLEETVQEVKAGRINGMTIITSGSTGNTFRTTQEDKFRHLGVLAYEMARLTRLIEASSE